MDHTETATQETSRTWTAVALMTAAVLLWGFFLFAAIGDRGAPPWDFSAIDDLPGSSAYGVHGPKESPVLGPAPVTGGRPLVPQHVGGEGKP